MKKILAILGIIAATSASADVSYSNGRVLINDEVVSGTTDFKINLSISDSEREHFMREIFRHRLLGYLQTTTVPENAEAAEKIKIRLLELQDISQKLSLKKKKIFYNGAQPKIIADLAGTPTELPKQPVGNVQALLTELQEFDVAYSNSDYLKASNLLLRVQNNHKYITSVLPSDELAPYKAEYNRVILKTTNDGILKSESGHFASLNLVEPDSSQIGSKVRALLNYEIGLQQCSGSSALPKLLIAYVFIPQAIDLLYLKTRSSVQTCDPADLTSLLDAQIAKINIINSLKGSPISYENRTDILDMLSRSVRNPSESIKNGFISQISEIIGQN